MYSDGELSAQGPVNLGSPLTTHPLNNGRKSWWTTLANWYGGPIWFDFVGKQPLLYTATVTGSFWTPRSNKGGTGSFHFNANGTGSTGAQFADTAYPYYNSITFLCWTRRIGNNGVTYNAIASHAPSTSTTGDWFLYWTGSNVLSIDIPFVVANVITGTTTITDHLWHRVGFTRIPGVSGHWIYQLYIDGKADGSSVNTTNAAGTSNYPFGLGSYQQGPHYGLMELNDATVYNVGLNASLIALDYELSQQGYPGVLVRIPDDEILQPTYASANATQQCLLTEVGS